ncbi:replication initiation protein [Cetobacterium sp.]|uniref:replication initiation protein n=1 Tax=Cetobacterium sp. TaxID=2071632 RepID=UPI003F343DF3
MIKEKSDLFKPSLVVTNSVPLTALQLDLFNYFLKKAYSELEKNIFQSRFIFSLEEIRNNCNPRITSYSKLLAEVEDIYNKEFNFNILGKDKSIEQKVKSRFIPTIVQKKDSTVEIMLEPITIDSFRIMIAKKQGLDFNETKNEELKVSPYAKLSYTAHKNLKFYPAKVIYEIIKDYENISVPEIEINNFKIITDTVNKYETSYNSLVLKKAEKLLNEEFNINVKIIGVKSGRNLIAVKIESDLNLINGVKSVKLEEIESEFHEYLKAGGLDPKVNYPKTVLSGFLKSKKYVLVK